MKSLQTKNFKLKTQSKSTGFTLIELLVVIAIIGMLSSVVLASMNSARVKARDARRLADMKQLQNALELYNSDHQGYPGSGSGDYLTNINSTFKTGGYIAALPQDPSRGTAANGYLYYSTGGSSNTSRSSYLLRMYNESEATWCKVSLAKPSNTKWSGDSFCSEL